MPLVPGEELSEVLRGKVSPSVKRRWDEAYHMANARHEMRDADGQDDERFAAFVDKLLTDYEKSHAVGRPIGVIR